MYLMLWLCYKHYADTRMLNVSNVLQMFNLHLFNFIVMT